MYSRVLESWELVVFLAVPEGPRGKRPDTLAREPGASTST